MFERRGFKNVKFKKGINESISSFATAVFENKFLLECYIQRAKNLTS